MLNSVRLKSDLNCERFVRLNGRSTGDRTVFGLIRARAPGPRVWIEAKHNLYERDDFRRFGCALQLNGFHRTLSVGVT